MTLPMRSASLLLGLSLLSASCIKKTLLNGQIESTRTASAAVDTLHDFEVANTVAYAGLAQFEGMHYLAPENENALFMLTKGWTGATFAFTEEMLDEAEDRGDVAAVEYHKARAIEGYERAFKYGVELLEHKAPGFEAARRNDETLRQWVVQFDEADDAANLFWTGYAWMRRTFMGRENPAFVSELWIGVALVQRSLELDETYLWGTAHTVLGSYHARAAMAELDESKKHFERGLEISGGKTLLTKLQYAMTYHCMKGDKASYEALVQEVLDAGDIMPEQRLQNTIAKRKAKRAFNPERTQKNCGFTIERKKDDLAAEFDAVPAPAAAPAAPKAPAKK